jgi:hypothetical protein
VALRFVRVAVAGVRLGRGPLAPRHPPPTSSQGSWLRAAILPADIGLNLAATAGVPHRRQQPFLAPSSPSGCLPPPVQ